MNDDAFKLLNNLVIEKEEINKNSTECNHHSY